MTPPESLDEAAIFSGAHDAYDAYDVDEANEPHETDEAEIVVLGARGCGWIGFNSRLLARAAESKRPLLERLKLVATVATNIDEFVMKRIGGLQRQQQTGIQELRSDGRRGAERIAECHDCVGDLERRQRALHSELHAELVASGIRIVRYDELDSERQQQVRDDYYQNIFPLVTPQTSDPAHPFPFVSSLSLNLLVRYSDASASRDSVARIKVPLGPGVPRFLQVEGERILVPLESVMMGNLDLLLPGAEIEDCTLFRVTRNAALERDEDDAGDSHEWIESGGRERRVAPIVRLEVAGDMSIQHRRMLASELGLGDDSHVFEVSGIFQMRDLMELTQGVSPALAGPSIVRVARPAIAREDRPAVRVIR